MNNDAIGLYMIDIVLNGKWNSSYFRIRLSWLSDSLPHHLQKHAGARFYYTVSSVFCLYSAVFCCIVRKSAQVRFIYLVQQSSLT